MASRSVSPGGALLRASRVFSIPPALPRPSGDLSSTAVFNSDTATLPYPTHLSITTPRSSLVRGDWGFKRPLPLRSTTKTSTPVIRVESIDTFEHITEYGSSADHALSLRKWQEMGIPITTPVQKPKMVTSFSDPDNIGQSVFEEDIDSTSQMDGGGARKEDVRWKFKGPWLASQNDGEFNHYLRKEVRKRKTEFNEFLRASCANVMNKEAQRNATGEGEIATTIGAADVTETQLTDYIKNLRQDKTGLYKQIRDFLDLPPPPAIKANAELQMFDFLSRKPPAGEEATFAGSTSAVSASPYAERGPPKSHPAAGITYARTAAHIHNHPEFGPQKNPPPVQARVVMPKGAAVGNFAPLLGVGGFVVEVPAGDSFKVKNSTTKRGSAQKVLQPGLLNIEPDKVGGSKSWVHPKSATIDAKGRVVMVVVPGDEEAIAVKEGTTDQIPRIETPYSSTRTVPNYMSQVGLPTPNRGFGDASRRGGSYGLASRLKARGEVDARGSYGLGGQSPPTPRRGDTAARDLSDLFDLDEK